MIGNASALAQSEDWAALLADAKDRRCFVSSTTCIQRGLLPEPVAGPPMGSSGILHPRPGGLMSRGRGMSGPHGGRHSSSGDDKFQLFLYIYHFSSSASFPLFVNERDVSDTSMHAHLC